MADIDTRAALGGTEAADGLEGLRDGGRATTQPHSLSPEALAVAGKPLQTPVSPIVLAGFVRMVEFALIVIVGMAIFWAYLPSGQGLYLRYQVATLCIAA